ncbi:MAG: hypothetical protein IEMM0001_1199 [bacterium]|nr:MAG: hypothetical protein IEMM0001_1199 [bacterium]
MEFCITVCRIPEVKLPPLVKGGDFIAWGNTSQWKNGFKSTNYANLSLSDGKFSRCFIYLGCIYLYNQHLGEKFMPLKINT